MPRGKRIIDKQARGKTGYNPAHPDLPKEALQQRAVLESTVTFEQLSALHDVEELKHLVRNLIEKHRNVGETPKVTEGKNAITYHFAEKNITLSIARNVERAMKHFHPTVTIHNPKDNEFYRITVRFEESREKSK